MFADQARESLRIEMYNCIHAYQKEIDQARESLRIEISLTKPLITMPFPDQARESLRIEILLHD